MQFPAIPGWGLLLVVVAGPSPILAEGLGCSSPPFLAGVCCRVVVGGPSPILAEGPGCISPPFLAGSAGGGGGWSLANPSGGSWVRFPAVPGLGVLQGGGGWSLANPGEGPRLQFPAILGWGLLPVVVGGPSPILAEGLGCSSPPFLAGSAAGAAGWSLANPGGGLWVQFPAILGWGLLLVLVGGPSPILVEGPGRSSPSFLAGVCCWCWWVVPRQSWRRALGAVPRHYWLAFNKPVPTLSIIVRMAPKCCLVISSR